jgi:hypothetical protein
MQIGWEIFLIESQLQGISPSLEGILLHEEVRSKKWWHCQVLRLNFVGWLKVFVNFYGLGDC